MTGTISRVALNRLIRLMLAITGAITGVLMVAAARPPFRYLGNVPAVVGEREQIQSDWAVPGVYVTVISPAVVVFENDIRDAVCAAVKIERGEAPTELDFDDYLPQPQWDQPPQNAVVFRYDDFRGTSRDGTILRVENDVLAPLFALIEGYTVNWLTPNNLVLYDGDAVGGVVCYRFTIPGEQDTVIPNAHTLIFNVRNIHVTRRPEYFFRYESALQIDDPQGTYTLSRIPVRQFLETVSQQAPFAVRKDP